MSELNATAALPPSRSLFVADKRTKKRHASERVFRGLGLGAIIVGLMLLIFLLYTILNNGLSAFRTTSIEMELVVSQEDIDEAESATLKTKQYAKLAADQLVKQAEEKGIATDLSQKDLLQILSDDVGAQLREFYMANPQDIGEPANFTVNAGSYVNGYVKGRLDREDVANSKNASAAQFDFVDQLREAGLVRSSFDWNFITGVDASDKRPESAGFGAAMMGSLAMMVVVIVLAIPIGVGASIYLEEFAPKNRWTDMIEVNISNLAAVPSIVFGILGLTLFINIMGIPRSAPLVGGLVLVLMTLPTIIISTRAALRAVPPSIRDAALGVGASRLQTITHHVLPLAAPGILTGSIIGLAQALGESAPLLLIGMSGFVGQKIPDSLMGFFLEPNSAMPAQIFRWATRDDAAFIERAWGGIIILLVFLVFMNAVAIILRRRFERRW